MRTLQELIANPSALDSLANYMGDTDPAPGHVVVLTQNRDSDLLARSNWDAALGILGDHAEIDRFGHWACGWYEAMHVDSNNPEALALAEDICDRLANYPVLDESAYSDLEHEEATDCWRCLPLEKRVELCTSNGVSCFAARHDYLPDDDDGSILQHCRGD